MHIRKLIISVLILSLMITSGFAKGVEVGKSAPGFALNDVNGKAHALKDYLGKYVVLEWTNYDCPFVKKHYDSGNMQMLQKKYTGKDVVWLSINSSAPGKQGNFTSDEVLKRAEAHGASFSAYLLDQDGKVGKTYGAKTTPHMFVINPKGKLIYMGGIDDIKSTRVDDVAKATNYVGAALDAAMAGKAVVVTSSKPYGCSVKY